MLCNKRQGFSLIELLVVIAIIAILAAILFPIFLKAKESGKRTQCVSNLRQLGVSVRMYQQDYSGDFPSSKAYPGSPWGFSSWVKWTLPYAKNRRIFNCPGASQSWLAGTGTDTIKVGYSYNEYINFRDYGFSSEGVMAKPSQVLLLADGYRYSLTHDWDDDLWAGLDGLPSGMNRIRYADGPYKGVTTGKPMIRHSGPSVLFCDGHAEKIDSIKFRATNYPGAVNKNTCEEWPVMYPGAKALRR